MALNPTVVIMTLIVIFVGLLAFVVANTAFSYMKPTFDDINQSLSKQITNRIDYDSTSAMITNFFYVSLAIIIIIPFVWLGLRVIKKEPEPAYYGGY